MFMDQHFPPNVIFCNSIHIVRMRIWYQIMHCRSMSAMENTRGSLLLISPHTGGVGMFAWEKNGFLRALPSVLIACELSENFAVYSHWSQSYLILSFATFLWFFWSHLYRILPYFVNSYLLLLCSHIEDIHWSFHVATSFDIEVNPFELPYNHI